MQANGAVTIGTSEQAAALFASTFSHAGAEELRVAHLDGKRNLIALRYHGGGGASGVDFPIRAIVLEALMIGSHGLVVAHNHPSGDPTPSRADVNATRALTEVAVPLGIRIYDHLVFAEREWRSLMALGLL